MLIATAGGDLDYVISVPSTFYDALKSLKPSQGLDPRLELAPKCLFPEAAASLSGFPYRC